MLDIRRGFASSDWPAFEAAVERGKALMHELASEVADSTDKETGLPAECSVEFRLAQSELEDKNVTKCVRTPSSSPSEACPVLVFFPVVLLL